MSTYVAIGSACWDEVEGDGERRLGGSVLFAGQVARAAGWDVRVITSGTPELEAAVQPAEAELAVPLDGPPLHLRYFPRDGTVFIPGDLGSGRFHDPSAVWEVRCSWAPVGDTWQLTSCDAPTR